jgi:hypothetical protein
MRIFLIPVVLELRKLGHDVLTIQDAGYANQEYADDAVLASASADRRVVLTISRKHFLKLHKRSQRHHGIIICTADLDFVGQAVRIHQAIQEIVSWQGQLIRVNRPQR